jgi:hypothetical protein
MFSTACNRRPQQNKHLNPAGEKILTHLAEVAALRARRDGSPEWAAQLRQVKEFQHRRFEATYADLLAQPRYARAARFFLQELYGPGDFSARDQQFARVVPALVRLFPDDIVVTVALLSQLHALSEKLDSEMADSLQGALNNTPLNPHRYAQAWRHVGQAARRATVSRPLHAQNLAAPKPAFDARARAPRRPGGIANLPGSRLRYLSRHGGC